MIQVHTLDSVYQCHASPEDARLSCPRSEDIREGKAREVMLPLYGIAGPFDSTLGSLAPIYSWSSIGAKNDLTSVVPGEFAPVANPPLEST